MSSETIQSGQLRLAALDYAAAGIAVFPLWWPVSGRCACDQGDQCGSPAKHPRIPGGLNRASGDCSRVSAWWRAWPEANIGVPAGANIRAVIDVDPGHGGDESLAKLADWLMQAYGIDIMATRIHRTGTGGLHLIFRDPAGGIKTVARAFGADYPGLDTRGRGGYVVAPPSRHVCGGLYEVLDSRPAAGWPTPLTNLMNLTPPAEPSREASRDTSAPAAYLREGSKRGWALAGLERECEKLRSLTAVGNRNHELNKSACKMGSKIAGGWIDEDTCVRALIEATAHWVGNECSAADNLATIRSGIRGGMRNPHPGPAPRRTGVPS